MSHPDWLPPLVCLEDHGGDWQRYEAALYEVFRDDFVNARPSVEGQNVVYRRRPLVRCHENTFWHLISTGRPGDLRIRDRSRCERIRWPRAVIDAHPSPDVRAWRSKRGSDTNLVVALPDFSYVVILGHRRGSFLLLTAYPVERRHRRRKLRKEWEKNQQEGNNS